MPTGHNASAWRDAAFVTAAENTDNRASVAQTVKNLNVCHAPYVLLRNPFFSSCPRQVSPVFESLRFQSIGEWVCTKCQFLRPLIGISDRYGPKCQGAKTAQGLFPENLARNLLCVAVRSPHFPRIACWRSGESPISGKRSAISDQCESFSLWHCFYNLSEKGGPLSNSSQIGSPPGNTGLPPNLILCRNPLYESF